MIEKCVFVFENLTGNTGVGWLEFFGISTLLGYLMPTPVHRYNI